LHVTAFVLQISQNILNHTVQPKLRSKGVIACLQQISEIMWEYETPVGWKLEGKKCLHFQEICSFLSHPSPIVCGTLLITVGPNLSIYCGGTPGLWHNPQFCYRMSYISVAYFLMHQYLGIYTVKW